ncbi:hypothetical protein GCM10027160_09530 [Streptomyces calidiresistens]
MGAGPGGSGSPSGKGRVEAQAARPVETGDPFGEIDAHGAALPGSAVADELLPGHLHGTVQEKEEVLRHGGVLLLRGLAFPGGEVHDHGPDAGERDSGQGQGDHGGDHGYGPRTERHTEERSATDGTPSGGEQHADPRAGDVHHQVAGLADPRHSRNDGLGDLDSGGEQHAPQQHAGGAAGGEGAQEADGEEQEQVGDSLLGGEALQQVLADHTFPRLLVPEVGEEGDAQDAADRGRVQRVGQWPGGASAQGHESEQTHSTAQQRRDAEEGDQGRALSLEDVLV